MIYIKKKFSLQECCHEAGSTMLAYLIVYEIHGYCTFIEIMCHFYVMSVLCSVIVHCYFVMA